MQDFNVPSVSVKPARGTITGPDSAGPEPRLSESLGFCRKLYDTLCPRRAHARTPSPSFYPPPPHAHARRHTAARAPTRSATFQPPYCPVKYSFPAGRVWARWALGAQAHAHARRHTAARAPRAHALRRLSTAVNTASSPAGWGRGGLSARRHKFQLWLVGPENAFYVAGKGLKACFREWVVLQASHHAADAAAAACFSLAPPPPLLTPRSVPL